MSARKRQPNSESSVYIDRDSAGTILVRNGVVSALDADGAKLGTFPTDRAAMAAIIDSAKWASPTPRRRVARATETGRRLASLVALVD